MTSPPRKSPFPSSHPAPSTALPRTSPPSPTTAIRPNKQPVIDYDAILRSPSHARFRSKYLAIGVAVIAASGALFGAQLKTVWQDWRANETRRLALEVSGSGGSGAAAASTTNGASSTGGNVEEMKAVGKEKEDDGPSLSDLNRSISSLETVRGQLVRKRMQEEQRLGNLRERMERKRVLEERRAEAAAVAATAQGTAQGAPTGER